MTTKNVPMLRQIALVFAVLLALAAPAWAWTQVYSWAASPGATGYRFEKSVDTGVTWTLVSSPPAPTFTYVGAEAGFVIFRISACNAASCTVRFGDGLWHNEGWVPVQAPTNLGVQ